MDHNGVMVNTSEFQFSGLTSIPGRGEYDLLFNVDAVNLQLKNNRGGEGDRRPNFVIFVV